MTNKFNIDNLEIMSFLNGLVFFAPVALLVRTRVGINLEFLQERLLILWAIRTLLFYHRSCF